LRFIVLGAQIGMETVTFVQNICRGREKETFLDGFASQSIKDVTSVELHSVTVAKIYVSTGKNAESRKYWLARMKSSRLKVITSE
jgi:hypothetical protein